MRKEGIAARPRLLCVPPFFVPLRLRTSNIRRGTHKATIVGDVKKNYDNFNRARLDNASAEVKQYGH